MKAFSYALLILCISLDAQTPAFPTAEGFGKFSQGGRGGKVLFVTTLLDNPDDKTKIPGSLRTAIETEGPRTIIFQVSGIIHLRRPLVIKKPFITIAGQSAPGSGICLQNHVLQIETHDVILRHLRIRPGDIIGLSKKEDGKHWETDALCITGQSKNVIIDHSSMSWANDEVCSISGAGTNNISIQWCFITESLNQSTHKKGAHGYGSLIRSNGNISFHHNLYAFHRSRSPRPGTYGEGSILLDFRNNFMYMGGKGYTSKDPSRINFVGNFHPDTPFNATASCTFYTSNNQGTFSGGVNNKAEFKVSPVITSSALEAKVAIMASAGATLPQRDSVDNRIVNLIKNKKGKLINSQKEVGGWPKLKESPPYIDSDKDGMPDTWEKEHKLNPNLRDNNQDSDKDGYTNIEEYLNSTDPHNKN